MDLDVIVQQIKNSSKYQSMELCEDTIKDLILREFNKHKKTKDALKAAKKKLHCVVAPYLGDPSYDIALRELKASFSSNNLDLIKDSCALIMAEHASTKERLPILDKFYAKIFDLTGKPSTILDIACGLNPLSFPWMGLSNSIQYYAYDIHRVRVEFLNQYFLLQGLQPLSKVQDTLVQFPQQQAEIAFIFKEVHRFENRRRGCTLPLLDALQVHYIVISLATRNLTGRWDLKERNRQLLYSLVNERPWHIAEIELENELIFVLDKSAKSRPDRKSQRLLL